jgi:outer membrane protein assembly factor BamE (lipoprotein component of BamABCDE complex)
MIISYPHKMGRHMQKIFSLSIIISLIGLVVFGGCEGSKVHRTIKYHSLQSTIEDNNKNLLSLSIGMTKEQTIKLMGKPERSEGYRWGSFWLYRTAMTSGVYGTADADFTPIMFDKDAKVVGWGRNFYTEQMKRHSLDINIKNN